MKMLKNVVGSARRALWGVQEKLAGHLRELLEYESEECADGEPGNALVFHEDGPSISLDLDHPELLRVDMYTCPNSNEEALRSGTATLLRILHFAQETVRKEKERVEMEMDAEVAAMVQKTVEQMAKRQLSNAEISILSAGTSWCRAGRVGNFLRDARPATEGGKTWVRLRLEEIEQNGE